MNVIKKIFFLIACSSSFSVFALDENALQTADSNTWNPLGGGYVSQFGIITGNAFAISPKNILFVAEISRSAYNELNVYTYTNNQWLLLNGTVNSDNNETVSLATDAQGVPYVGSMNFTDSNSTHVAVNTLENNSWKSIFSSAKNESLEISRYSLVVAKLKNNVTLPYLFYINDLNQTGNVIQFKNNHWVAVGNSFPISSIVPNTLNDLSLSIVLGPNQAPYIAWRDNNKIAVMALSSSKKWQLMGTEIPTSADHFSLAVNSTGLPYIAYFADTKTGYESVHVVLLNSKNAWQAVSNLSFFSAYQQQDNGEESIHIALSTTHIPFVTFSDDDQAFTATLNDQGKWALVGNSASANDLGLVGATFALDSQNT